MGAVEIAHSMPQMCHPDPWTRLLKLIPDGSSEEASRAEMAKMGEVAGPMAKFLFKQETKACNNLGVDCV